MATPWLVPFSNSSYLVCSQVRVPCVQPIAASNGQRSASRNTFIMNPDWPIGRNNQSVTQAGGGNCAKLGATVGSGVGVKALHCWLLATAPYLIVSVMICEPVTT